MRKEAIKRIARNLGKAPPIAYVRFWNDSPDIIRKLAEPDTELYVKRLPPMEPIPDYRELSLDDMCKMFELIATVEHPPEGTYMLALFKGKRGE